MDKTDYLGNGAGLKSWYSSIICEEIINQSKIYWLRLGWNIKSESTSRNWFHFTLEKSWRRFLRFCRQNSDKKCHKNGYSLHHWQDVTQSCQCWTTPSDAFARVYFVDNVGGSRWTDESGLEYFLDAIRTSLTRPSCGCEPEMWSWTRYICITNFHPEDRSLETSIPRWKMTKPWVCSLRDKI